MHRRRFLGGLAALPPTLVLASCAPSASPAPSAANAPATSPTGASVAAGSGGEDPLAGQNVSIRFESYNYGTPGVGGKGTQQLIDEFQAAYPNIHIEPRNLPSNGGTAGILNTVVSETAAGDPPDIAQLVLNTVDYVVNNLPVVAIDTIAPPSEYDDTMRHILPQALALGTVNGHLYGSPYTFSTPTLFYNADIFKAAGLDPDLPPTTWEQVEQYGAQIRDRTGKAAFALPTPLSGDWIVQSLVSSNGGATLSDDRRHARFNEAPAIEVFRWWQGLVNDGIHPTLTDNDISAALSNGNLAMHLNSTALLPTLSTAAQDKFDLRTTGEPSFGSKPVAPVNSGSALFMLSKDPLKQRAAWEFLHFAASQRGNTIITSVIGYVPQRDDVVDDPNYLKPFLDKDPRMLPTIHQLANLQAWLSWPGPNAVQAIDVYTQAILNVTYQGQDVQQTMDAAAARVDDLLRA